MISLKRIYPLFVESMFLFSNSIDAGLTVSVADYLAEATSGLQFGIIEIPFLILIMFQINKDDWNVLYVLKLNSKKKVFNIQCIRVVILSICMTLYHTISIMFWSLISGYELICWDDVNSNYVYYNRMISDIKFKDFLWRYMLEIFILMLVLLFIALVIDWGINKIVGIIVIVGCAILERNYIDSNFKIFYKTLLSTPITILNVENVFKHVLIGLIMIVIIYISGRFIARRKEFLK